MPEIRKFDEASIQRHIDEALSALGPGDHGAVVAHYDVGGRPALSVYGRVGEHFSYVGTLDWNWRGTFGGSAELRYKW